MKPSTPQNLEELVQNDKIPILTTSSAFQFGQAAESHSILKIIVVPDLLKDETLTSLKAQTYRGLLNAYFLTHYPIYIAKNISSHGCIWTSNQSKVALGKNEIFAVVDYLRIFKQFGSTLTLFRKYKPANPHKSMSFYTSRTVWLVKKNFFTNIFATGLSYLVESGIYQRWDTNRWIESYQMQTLIQFRRINKQANKSIETAELTGAEATTNEEVRVPFVLFLGMHLGSLVIFIGEFKWISVTPISKI